MIDIDKTADFLLQNRNAHRVVENIPPEMYPQSLAQAYLVQDRLVSLMQDQYNSTTCGYKLACTNPRVIALLGVDGPLSGRLFSHSTHTDDAELQTTEFNRRIVELEFGFVMGKDVPYNEIPYDATSIMPYIDSIVPAIEIVDHHYTDFTRVGGNALAADNAIHGASILGAKFFEWQCLDLARHPALLSINGKPFSRGMGKNVLGDPLNAMAWLANHLQSRDGALKCGEVVSTGTACEIYNADKGDRILADFGILGSVSTRFV